ncbi:MAG: tRNA uridine-5-carboxymethylaminomethyl(34) synthesis GTPase MnmE [Gemmatimonadaceae bacterium]
MSDLGASAAGIAGATDTIVATATAQGRGALSVVRISGVRAHEIGRALCRRWPNEARRATLTEVRDDSGIVLDRGIVVRFDAPASFTGEDSVEISTHGGLVVPTTVVAAAVNQGARLALAGEFTRRALLNGKLDILQAEATADLIAAGSRAAQRLALHQLDGGLSRRIASLRERVIEIEALIAYDIDFPEEDDGPVAPARVIAALKNLEEALQTLLATARGGELVREGALVVLAGVPNAGKSSLFNALLGRSRAIVTPVPGTTRDALEAVIDTEPWPIRIVDTAGLRSTNDLVERLGIEVSESYVRRAAVVLCCGEDAHALRSAVAAARNAIGGDDTDGPRLVLVQTKIDLPRPAHVNLAALGEELSVALVTQVSAETGAGIQHLLKSLGDVLAESVGPPELDAPVLTQARHQHGVKHALTELAAFREGWLEQSLPATIAAVHLHAAAEALRDLIGGVNTEQVLDELFRRFCVGK